jgi:hypothetical protein
MNVKQLTDYIINSDLEVAIIRGNVAQIREYLEWDEMAGGITDEMIGQAVAAARKDPYICKMALVIK